MRYIWLFHVRRGLRAHAPPRVLFSPAETAPGEVCARAFCAQSYTPYGLRIALCVGVMIACLLLPAQPFGAEPHQFAGSADWAWSGAKFEAPSNPPPRARPKVLVAATGIKVQEGVASYVHSRLHGRRTASGEKYDEHKFTAAHRTLPMGTVVQVRRLSNGRTVLVRINDRGPFAKNRLIDVSRQAAKTLNMLRGGVSRVRVDVLSDARGKPLRKGDAFYVQLETASSPERAAAASARIIREMSTKNSKKIPAIHTFERARDRERTQLFVGMGPFATFSEAQKVLFRLPAKSQGQLICARVR